VIREISGLTAVTNILMCAFDELAASLENAHAGRFDRVRVAAAEFGELLVSISCQPCGTAV
jgi:hypothetical protein